MFKKNWFILFLIAFFIVLGCAKKESTLTIGYVGNITENLNLYKVNTITSTFRDFFYDFLVIINGDFTYSSKIISIQSENQQTWILELLSDPILFHDGSKLTIEDIMFSIQTAMKYQSDLQIYSQLIESIQVDSEKKRLFIYLDQPYNDLPYLLSYVLVIKVQEASDLESLTYQWNEINGTGPFQFHSRTGEFLKLTRFESYTSGKPKVDTIQAKLYTDTEKLWNDLATNQVDMVNTVMMDYSRIESVLSGDNVHSHQYLQTFCYSLLFNSNQGFFKNKEIRAAFDQYLDKKSIFNRVLQEDGVLAKSTLQFVPFGSTCEDMAQQPVVEQSFSESLTSLGYKLSESGSLVDQNDEPVVLKVVMGEADLLGQFTIRSIMEQLLSVGIDLEIIEVDFNTVINQYLATGDFDLFFFFFRCEPYADFNYKFWHSDSIENGFNFGNYRNPVLDETLERGRKASTLDDKIQAYADFVREFNQNPPASLLFFRNNYVLTTGEIENFKPHSMDWTPEPHLWSLQR